MMKLGLYHYNYKITVWFINTDKKTTDFGEQCNTWKAESKMFRKSLKQNIILLKIFFMTWTVALIYKNNSLAVNGKHNSLVWCKTIVYDSDVWNYNSFHKKVYGPSTSMVILHKTWA